MSAPLVHRPTRATTPLSRPEPEEIAPPPALEGDSTGTPIQFLLPVIGAMSSVIMMVVLRHGRPLFLMIAAVVFVVAIVGGVGFALSARGRATRQARQKRQLYLDYLERRRSDLLTRAARAREDALALDPEPSGLVTLVRDPERLWERRRQDDDFLSIRVGLAAEPWFELFIPADESPVEPADPILRREAELIAETHATVDHMPSHARLHDAVVVAVIGPRERTLAAVHAMLLQLAAHHAPDDVELAAVYAEQQAGDWRGLDLLPHAQDLGLFDGPVPARRIAQDVTRLAHVLGPNLTDRAQEASAARRRGNRSSLSRLIVVVDDHGRLASRLPLPDASMGLREQGITVIHLLDRRTDEPSDVDVRIELAAPQDHDDAGRTDDPGRHDVLTHDAATPRSTSVSFAADEVTPAQFEAQARAMAALRVARAAAPEGTEEVATEITDLLGVARVDELDPATMWRPRPPGNFLRVPFGVDDTGRPIDLDLKESAQMGMGPHGICVGATGSGKSELLRTLILALALAHPPEDLAMILVDYKGGAAFAPFDGLPHLAGLIDNLADDPQLTARARASLQGEVVRRQQLLKDAGSSPSITHYRQLREERPDLPALPHLFVVIDEFGELLTAEPEFVDLFLQIGRIGRSIGVHLLLSSQRIESGKLRGLDTYLSYRLGLRTFSESESQVVLNTTDAFHLPPVPGYGILKVDTSVYQRFRAGYVSGPLPTGQQARIEDAADGPRVHLLPLYNGIGAEDGGDEPAAPVLRRPETGPVLVDVAVERMRHDDRAVRPVWLQPLPDRLSLGQILDSGRTPCSALEVVVGLEDDPGAQQQRPWTLDLTRAGGHLAIIGGPQSGRSTLLRTIGASLALSHTPRQVTIYGMDLTGGGLRRLEGFPHVGGAATRTDRGRLQRLVEELSGMLADREQLFKDEQVDSLSQFRSLHASGRFPAHVAADIVLLLDGYGALRQDFTELEEPFVELMQRAASYGIHVILAMTRWSELRMAHQPLFGIKVELRLNDPSDSTIDRKLAGTLSAETPGRALTAAKTLAHVALPSLEVVESDDIGEALEALARRSAASWSGPAAAPIRLLPNRLDPSELPDAADEPDAVPLGLRQDTMGPALWDFAQSDQHLVVLGDARSGKSTVLRAIAAGLVERFTPAELAIAVVDVRGHVPDVIPPDYLAAHARNLRQASGLAASIATELEQRAERSAEERARSPRVVLLVDDHDLVTAGGNEPLAPLLPHLPAARDLGLHIVVARPVAGATRALYGQVLQGLRDTGGSVLLLSGDRSEGQVLPRVYPERFGPGRGRFVRRGERPVIVQVADVPAPGGGVS